MQLALTIIPQEIIDKYKLMDKEKNGKVYIIIDKGMYELPHAGILANNFLVTRLTPHGYCPCKHTHCLWRHDTKPVTFTLVVDDFGIKYSGKENADHFLNALKENYEVTEDWAGKLYCGISLDWDYENKTVDLSIPGYIANALHKFQHKQPDRPQHAPYPARTPQYGSKVQLTPAVLDSPTLTPQGRKRIQQVVGALLYYGRAIDGTIMTSISSLASQHATATEGTEAKLIQILNYCAAGGHFFMSSTPRNGVQQHNGLILTLSTILRMMVASAAEAEIGALFLNVKEGVNIRNTLKEMGHPQLATPMQTDNTTAHGILCGTCKQQRSKSIDMRFYWVRNRAQQGQFDIGWGPSAQNLGDCFTKHPPPRPP
jgi:hypothetical protein